ncbi:MAG: DUF1217 domain-containing protein [Paracoccaceae bacterium]|nr:DUF1217 domain-containing protein [Paracoccaceae bacterium]
MTYQPAILSTGNLGWSLFQSTREAQEEAFLNSPTIERDKAYFRENIGSVTSAEELVNDRRLLTVALGAFGLDEDLDSRAFIQKVLEEGSEDEEAFANKLSDDRYKQLTDAFGFAEGGKIGEEGFVDDIVGRFETNQFEIAVGQQDQSMRLAMSFDRELEAVLAEDNTEDGVWFSIMGTPPLREVFEKAFFLPESLGSIDVDQQLEVFKSSAERYYGDSNAERFTDPEVQEDLLRRFFLSSELGGQTSTTIRGSVALSLLQSAAAG